LNEEGLYPIRVRLRDLSLDRHISEALPKALFPPDRDLASTSLGHTCDDPFLGGRIFNKEVTFHGATICQYVLILDGWDEISISATEGIKARVARMLEQIRAEFLQRRAEFLQRRAEFLQRRGAPVRVIPSGRPSTAVIESLFLRESTPILTIRPGTKLRKLLQGTAAAMTAYGGESIPYGGVVSPAPTPGRRTRSARERTGRALRSYVFNDQLFFQGRAHASRL
jgi:hypothetical protein